MTYNPNQTIRPQRFERQTPYPLRNAPFVEDTPPAYPTLSIVLYSLGAAVLLAAFLWR